jgi:anti-sigma factor ChrR (cupin superfamily)
MELHTDTKIRVAVNTADMSWVASPVNGIDRKMLERYGDEIARATSLVRYAPDSSFTPHQHELGEEILVLDGVFQDEHGIALGSDVTITAESFGLEPTPGKLIAATRTRYTLARSDARTGEVHVHFPRVGYVLQKAEN